MAFHDVELPSDFQYASQFGPGFATIVQSAASGHEYRIARQAQGRHRFRLIKQLQDQLEAQTLKTFALARRGALHSFKLKDWLDFTSAADGISTPTNLDQIIGIGDATESQFQLYKAYVSGDPANAYERPITLPVSGSVVCALSGVSTTSFTVNAAGIVTFSSPPAAGAVITAGFEFRVPVRFGSQFDQWAALQADAFQVWSLPDLDCIEVLSEVETPERWNPGGVKSWGNVATNITLSLADGALQHLNPTAAMSIFLPPPRRIPGGDRVFTISVAPGATGSAQMRDDLGAAIGSPIGAGVVKQVGLIHSSTTSTWLLY